MLYGTPSVVLVDDTTDRIGIRTLVLSQMWAVPQANPTQEQIDAAEPAPPLTQKSMLLIGAQTRRVYSTFRTFWTYEGVREVGDKTVIFKDRKNSLDYSFEPGFAEVSLKRHPDYLKLLETYEGAPDVDGGEIVWPPETSFTSRGSVFGTYPGGIAGTSLNPMFGIESYFRMEGNYRFRYAEKSVATDIFSNVGYIAEKLPGEPPSINPKEYRNWLMAPPSIRRRGMIYDITENYWLSGPGGWPLPVYKEGFNR